MTLAQEIEHLLRAAFSPSSLEVQDESHLHHGHVGARPGGETHFRVAITAEAFRGKSRVETHRMIYSVLGDQMRERIHALAIEAKAP